MISLIRKNQNRQIHKNRKQISGYLENRLVELRKEKCVVTANGVSFSYYGNVLKLDSGDGCASLKMYLNHELYTLKGNFMECD